MALGVEEKRAILKLFPFLGENPIVFDIGSNKGSFTDLVLDEFGENCKLHLFEPNEKLLSYTEIKYEYKKNIKYVAKAAWHKRVVLQFNYFENENNELSSIYEDVNEWHGLPKKQKNVIAEPIDHYFVSNDVGYIDFLKIDCEGADVDVLIGCEWLLTNNKIKIIQIEYSPHYKRANHTFQEAIDIAKKYGYKVYQYVNDNYEEILDFVEDFRFENFVITKENIHNYSVGWNKEFIQMARFVGGAELALEIGTFEGLNAKYICENVIHGGRLVCIDPLADYYTPQDEGHKEMFHQQYQRFIGNTRGLNIDLIRKTSVEALPELHHLRFNLIYIDGDHDPNMVYYDACWSLAILKIGGHIIFDDYQWNDTHKGIDRFLEEFSDVIEVLHRDYQVVVKKYGDKYNVLTGAKEEDES